MLVKKSGKIEFLEGMRGVAAMGVVMLHMTYLIGSIIVDYKQFPLFSALWVFGNAGVQLFFVMSGFLLFMPYAKALLFEEKWPGTGRYYWRRMLRIVPGYYFSLVVLVVLVQRQYLRPEHWTELLLFLTFLMDGSKATFQKIDIPYWTLAIEVQFYVLLPVVAWGIYEVVKRVAVRARGRLVGVSVMCWGIIVIGLVVRWIGFQMTGGKGTLSGWMDVVRFVVFGVEGKFWEVFAVGMLISLCYVYAQRPEVSGELAVRLRKASLWLRLGAVVVLVFCALWEFRYGYNVVQLDWWLPLMPYTRQLLRFVVSIGWGMLLMGLLFGESLLKRVLESKLMMGLGTISYGVYLWHFPMMAIFKKYVLPHFGVQDVVRTYALFGGFFVLGIVPWCVVVYWLVERPFMGMKRKKVEKVLVKVSAE
ncbi:acyltransferase family protein [Ktedonospora formicarum]|uniref:acyltransferase family protein n=1 Tax=Ktedonospora formicarum TaxID=2778364 RepID=UPI001C68EB3F|nr:acyltransferase [Ktedonospora formicarum]